ncbi:chemotaxis protein CheD [Brevundimonas sp. SL130]|uniref:chemotaxis protein CheD n=1 Tax=Brevundimonas sp. SL130 TaxID=2995143 RepID=UPI00226C736E|nr:chemotaxis protein CheD [Brevundimonas sp. SL130]WAC58336.1 chemotaxis protein CheD [Brevundimonas sp. SL130]
MKHNSCSRAWDDEGRPVRHKSIAQGQYCISDDPDAVITTVLGSCVAACIRDPHRGIGGMNHFVLPKSPTPPPQHCDPYRYGDHLMPSLIDALIAKGAKLARLEAVVFGGASTFESFYNVGERNRDFALDFLFAEGITIIDAPRVCALGCRLEYWPFSGKAVQTPLGATRGARHRA